MTQLSPKMIQETPNEVAHTRSKSNILTNRQKQEQGTLNQEIYKKLFEKFNQRDESPQSSGSGRRMVDINEVYKLRQEMMEKYDKHVQSKRRLSMQNQNFKQMLKCKSERTGTKIGTSQEPSILVEERRLSKIDIQDFLLRVERSQERKEVGLSRAASQKSIQQQQWKMLPKSRMIVSRSLDKNAFQQTLNSARKAKPLFETFNFSPKLKKSISKTELKREQPDSERRFNHAMTAQDSQVAIRFEIDKMHASIRDVVQQAPMTQSLLATKTKKNINKIFQKRFDAIQSADGQVDMINLLKLLGAITSCTVEKRLVQNHQNLRHNVECLFLAILDLSGQNLNNERRRSSQFIVNKFLSEDKVKSAAQIVGQLEPICFTVAQERRIQQHFAEFATSLRKKRLSTRKYRTALGSPKPSKAALEAVDLHRQSQQQLILQDSNTVSTDTFKLKRDHYLNQMIDSTDKLPEPQPEAFQKRHTQADLRSAVKSQLASRKSLDRLDGLATGRKSVNANQKSRNTPSVYSQATENQIRTVRNKQKADLAQLLQQRTTKQRQSLKRPLTRQSDSTVKSPCLAQQFQAYDPAAAVAAQNLQDKCVVLSGRTSKASNAATKKQTLTSKKKVTTTATIQLENIENRALLFVQLPIISTQDVRMDTVSHSGQDQEGPSLTELHREQDQRQLTPRSLSIEISLPDNHAFQLKQEQTEIENQSSKSITPEVEPVPRNHPISTAAKDNQEEAKIQIQETVELQPAQDEYQEQIIDQQSRPSETIELQRDTEPLFDQQSRPSEKLEAAAVDQNEQQVSTSTKKIETDAEQLSDSQISQNQGHQMEEQGAKDIDHSNTWKESEELQDEQDQQRSLQLEEVNNPSEFAEQEQLIQARFSNISKKSSSKFLTDSDVDSDNANVVELEGNDVKQIKQQEKFTITEIGTFDAPNDNLIDRPKYMTFSQPSQDQDEQNPGAAREANESVRAILAALNLTHETAKNDQIDYNVQKQVSGSEQGKDTEQIESEQQNLTASPKSETAFEKYQRLKKEKESSLQDSAAKDRQSSCGSKESNKAPLSGKYTPRHASPKLSQMSDQRSWKSEVQVDMLEFRDENQYPLREEIKSPVLIETFMVVTEKPLLVEFSCALVPEQLPKLEAARKLKNLSFAEDLNQQTYSSQEQVPSKDGSLTDIKPSVTIESPIQLRQTENEDSLLNTVEQTQEAVLAQNIEIKHPEDEDIQKVENLPRIQSDELDRQEAPAPVDYSRQADQVEQEKKETGSCGQQSEELWLPDPVAPEPSVEPGKDQVKETKSIQGQLHAIKHGFLQFMNKKTNDQEIVQALPEKQPTSTTSQVYGQVNNMIKRVQDNLKEKAQENLKKQQDQEPEQEKPPSQTAQVFDSVNGMLKKVQENMKQTNFSDIFKSPDSIRDAFKPLQDKVQQSLPTSAAFKSITDKIPSETIDKLKQKLPKNSLVEMVTSTTENFKEGDFLSSVLTAAQDQARIKLQDTILADIIPVTQKPLTVENPYLKIERASNKQKEEAAAKSKINFVDGMAPVLDKLDQEYEAELKNKPKITEQKNQKRYHKDELSSQQSGTLVRKKTADSSTSSKKTPTKSRTTPPTQKSLKKSKTDQAPKKKKEQSTPKPVEKIQETKPIKKQSSYNAFPSRIVDAPEIMFFLPSWFQINGKRNKK